MSASTSAVVAFVITAVIGAAAGWASARIAPADKFSLVGLLLVPFWIGLEVILEGAFSILGARSKAARLLSMLGLLGCFYVAWFATRGVAL